MIFGCKVFDFVMFGWFKYMIWVFGVGEMLLEILNKREIPEFGF
jgi:hypothetical protein